MIYIRKKRVWPFLVAAVFLTLAAIVFQRMSGPNYPFKFKLETEKETYRCKLPKTQTRGHLALIEFDIAEKGITADIIYRRYPTNEEWSTKPFQLGPETMHVILPEQDCAGKLEYYIDFKVHGEQVFIKKDDPMVMRFNDFVPDIILWSHVAFMVLASYLSMVATLLLFFKRTNYREYLNTAFIALTTGGMLLGPAVQRFAFGEWWTGFPYGMDLTDNKTLITWLFYGFAVAINIKKDRPKTALIATLLFIAINLIPHSMFGSELDPTTGEIIQA